jgi:hypothetical protein
MRMMHRLSIRARLERLETVLRKGTPTPGREAFVEMLPAAVGERHLVMTSPAGAARCWFQERAGPGPGIEDFGEFESVLYLTTAEMRL